MKFWLENDYEINRLRLTHRTEVDELVPENCHSHVISGMQHTRFEKYGDIIRRYHSHKLHFTTEVSRSKFSSPQW